MDANTQTIYETLKAVAKSRQTIFYGDLSEDVDLAPQSEEFKQILRSIDSYEAQEGRPLLCALAVRRGFRIPSNGFFTHAETLGRYDPQSDDPTYHAVFWVDEVYQIWEYWQSH